MAPTRGKWSLYWLATNRPYSLVWLSGLLLAASFPPSPLNPLIFFAFVPLFVLVERTPTRVREDAVFLPIKATWVILFRILTLQILWRESTRGLKGLSYSRQEISGNAQIFRYTYFAFFLWNLAGCYWLMLTALGAKNFGEAIINATAGILAVVLNPLLMSIPFQFYSRIRQKVNPLVAAGLLTAFWISFELFHFRWELSWSWLTLGHALSPWPAWIQYLEFTGIFGASLHILVANVGVYAWVYQRNKAIGPSWKWGGFAAVWILLPLAIAPLLMNPGRAVFQPVGKWNVRVVQPVIDPFNKYNHYTWFQQGHLFADLIQSKPLDKVDLIVMPETAIPKALPVNALPYDTILKPLWRIVDTTQIPILTGMEEYAYFYDEETAPLSSTPTYLGHTYAWIDNYNAATLLRPDRHLETVRKSYLVPMVERMPFLGFLHFLKNYNLDLGTGMGGYGKPDSLNLLEMPDGTSIGVMICYESEFANHVRQLTAKGAKLLTVITNDGWWSQSSGYIQHAYMASLRAIENRRDVVRAANTGRSLFVDAWGYPHNPSTWWEPSILDHEVQLYDSQTFYVRFGDYIAYLALVVSLGALLWTWRKPSIP